MGGATIFFFIIIMRAKKILSGMPSNSPVAPDAPLTEKAVVRISEHAAAPGETLPRADAAAPETRGEGRTISQTERSRLL